MHEGYAYFKSVYNYMHQSVSSLDLPKTGNGIVNYFPFTIQVSKDMEFRVVIEAALFSFRRLMAEIINMY